MVPILPFGENDTKKCVLLFLDYMIHNLLVPIRKSADLIQPVPEWLIIHNEEDISNEGKRSNVSKFRQAFLGLIVRFVRRHFLEGIDVSMMGVALPAIRAELGMSTGSLQWVVSAYVLGYGGFMLLGGRASDLFGRKKMFLVWLTVFFAFSGLGGLSTEGWMLITARFVTGISAAFMTPAGLSIITTSFAEGTARNKALLVYAGTAAAGFSLGLVVGGILSEISWRWVFFGPVLLAFVILLAAIRLIPASGRPEASSKASIWPGQSASRQPCCF
ncbi:MFS transporter [Paenibacillus sp. JTLBN-2024]